jgi:bifunctional DNA-binding transcriptional regulator/antitoxin component of YhaV-PrlF toxin-antitoxin module
MQPSLYLRVWKEVREKLDLRPGDVLLLKV